MGDDTHEFQKEWRAIVLDKLASLEKSQEAAKVAHEQANKEINNSINEIKLSFVRQKTLDDMNERVNKLEAFKWKLLGGALAIQGLWAIASFALLWYQATHPVQLSIPGHLITK